MRCRLGFEVLHSAKSDIGLKRPHNEDRFVVDPLLNLYVVCDGMGGGNAGEVASAMAIDAIRSHLDAAVHNPDLPLFGTSDPRVSAHTNRLASALHLANEIVHRESWNQPACAGMGTTVVAVQLTGEVLSIAHVGDSRLYVARQGTLRPLTTDHSWVADQVRNGAMTEEEAERSPRRNIVTRALGVESTVEIDVQEIPVATGDLFLLCSDGLTRGVRSPDILRALSEDTDVARMADRLITMANDAGGDDNTTVVLLALRDDSGVSVWQRMKKRFAA